MYRVWGVMLLMLLVAGCSSGGAEHGGFGNVTIHIERHYEHHDGGPPATDPGPDNKRGNDSGDKIG